MVVRPEFRVRNSELATHTDHARRPLSYFIRLTSHDSVAYLYDAHQLAIAIAESSVARGTNTP